MKTSEKRGIAILIFITIVVIIIAIVMNKNGKRSKEETNIARGNEAETTTQLLDDGTILNNSAKLHETKKLEGLEVSQIQLTEKDRETQLIATVTNTSNTDQGDYLVMIKMLDQQGNEIATMEGYIGKIKPEKSIKISTEATFDSSNVYDFTIMKK